MSNTIESDMMRTIAYMYVPINFLIIYQSSLLMYLPGLSMQIWERSHFHALASILSTLLMPLAAASLFLLPSSIYMLDTLSQLSCYGAFPRCEVTIFDMYSCI